MHDPKAQGGREGFNGSASAVTDIAPMDHNGLRYPRSPRPRTSRRKGDRRRKPDAVGFLSDVVIGCAITGFAVWTATPAIEAAWTRSTRTPEEIRAIETSVHYPNCDAARAAGAAPIFVGSPGYREGLDRDGDGEACEPFHY